MSSIIGVDGQELRSEITLSDEMQADFTELMHLRKAANETIQTAISVAMDKHRAAGAEYNARIDTLIRSLVVDQLGFPSVEALHKTGRDIVVEFSEQENKFVARLTELQPEAQTRH